ncbi:hypothetical protein B0H19DRAFT_1182968 [Mycena capillaripes]|nr:hypothetical protein B0H19DRAFT_1182968 [Mycena capillaripes]
MAGPLSPSRKVTGLIVLFTLALLLTPAASVAAVCTALARGFASFVLISAAHQLFSLLFRETVLLARGTVASRAALEAGTGTAASPPTPRPIILILGPVVLQLCSLLATLVIFTAAWRPESEDPVLMKRPPLVAVGAGAVYYLRRIDSFLAGVVVGLAFAMGLFYMALTFGLFGDAVWAILGGVDEETSEVRVPLLFEEGGAIDGTISEQGKEGKAEV